MSGSIPLNLPGFRVSGNQVTKEKGKKKWKCTADVERQSGAVTLAADDVGHPAQLVHQVVEAGRRRGGR